MEKTFWVTDDGSYGYGLIATFSMNGWSKDQHAWLERHLNEGEADIAVIERINNGNEPEWDED